MAQIKFDTFDSWRKKNSIKDAPQIYLIYGESYLVSGTQKKLLSFLSGPDKSQCAIERMEGGAVSMGDILEEIATFPFLVQQKIVVVKNIPLFTSNSKSGELAFAPTDYDMLERFIETGMPDNHFLILTCQNIDKRKKIYKALESAGLVLDCSVAQGNRKADLDDQNKMLRQLSESILKQVRKRIEPQALVALIKRTGFDLERFVRNLEKLIAYSGKNPVITLADVNLVIVRDKKDPIFNLTNALMDKDVSKSLFYLQSLLTEGYHPLQILKSFENQVRKLLMAKCFVTHLRNSQGVAGFRQMGFNGFKQTVLPAIVAHDHQTLQSIAEQDACITAISAKKKPKGKKAGTNDLLLAPNPKNAYPVYQIFLKSENFSLAVLNQAMMVLSDLDYRLKTSAIDSRTQIESFIIHMCSKGGFDYATPEHQNRRHHI